MTLHQAVDILQRAAHDADQHVKLAISVGDRDKLKKFIDIRTGYEAAVRTLQAHERERKTAYDPKLAVWLR